MKDIRESDVCRVFSHKFGVAGFSLTIPWSTSGRMGGSSSRRMGGSTSGRMGGSSSAKGFCSKYKFDYLAGFSHTHTHPMDGKYIPVRETVWGWSSSYLIPENHMYKN